ncbi:MAG: hypothetical protein J0J04_04955 [Microbacterium sp.]|uniref:hypothetical protein n=1 Tax=Microbacterium sp. TaxID=51671 RepID=UPI001AD3B902|nr:hypothetical protein [Microbacterium sp.]MBN9214157.1 hypothetical protein [Microbacterium sp.]
MANPFLVLGGVAVGVITAGIGVLAVPGWIDNANDSAAMNDLGNIRGAESAAILQLGEYTDDFAILRSGELGVKFQKSEGVTLIGLEADTNESWCASVQSKSGRFFAASNVQAAIATGPGAESAMTTAGCDPDIITEILDKAADGAGPSGKPVDIGTPGPDGGKFTGGGNGSNAGGGNDGGSNNGGGNGGTWGGGDSGTVADAPLGPVAPMIEVFDVAWTSRGVFAADTNGKIVQSGADGHAHSLTFTGDITKAFSVFTYKGISSDAKGNLYVSAVGPFDTANPGAAVFAILKIAPDNSSTVVSTMPTGSDSPQWKTAYDGQVFYTYGGKLYSQGSDGAFSAVATPAGVPIVSDSKGTFQGKDSAGNLYFATMDTHYIVSKSGAVTQQPLLDYNNVSNLYNYTMEVGADGTRYMAAYRYLSKLDADGKVAQLANPQMDLEGWDQDDLLYPWVGALDPSGNPIIFKLNGDGGPIVMKSTTAGKLSTIMSD